MLEKIIRSITGKNPIPVISMTEICHIETTLDIQLPPIVSTFLQLTANTSFKDGALQVCSVDRLISLNNSMRGNWFNQIDFFFAESAPENFFYQKELAPWPDYFFINLQNGSVSSFNYTPTHCRQISEDLAAWFRLMHSQDNPFEEQERA